MQCWGDTCCSPTLLLDLATPRFHSICNPGRKMSQMQVFIRDALDLKVPPLSVYIIAEISLIRVELWLCFGSLAQIGQDESDKCAPAITYLLLGTFDLSQADSTTPPNTTTNEHLYSGLLSVQLLRSNIVFAVTWNTQKDWQACFQRSNYCLCHLETKTSGLGH